MAQDSAPLTPQSGALVVREPYRFIVMTGPYIKFSFSENVGRDLLVSAHKDGDCLNKKQIIKALGEGKIGPRTQIFLLGHGNHCKKKHYIDVVSDLTWTEEVLELLSECAPGTPLTVYVLGCYSAYAANGAKILPSGSVVIGFNYETDTGGTNEKIIHQLLRHAIEAEAPLQDAVKRAGVIAAQKELERTRYQTLPFNVHGKMHNQVPEISADYVVQECAAVTQLSEGLKLIKASPGSIKMGPHHHNILDFIAHPEVRAMIVVQGFMIGVSTEKIGVCQTFEFPPFKEPVIDALPLQQALCERIEGLHRFITSLPMSKSFPALLKCMYDKRMYEPSERPWAETELMFLLDVFLQKRNLEWIEALMSRMDYKGHKFALQYASNNLDELRPSILDELLSKIQQRIKGKDSILSEEDYVGILSNALANDIRFSRGAKLKIACKLLKLGAQPGNAYGGSSPFTKCVEAKLSLTHDLFGLLIEYSGGAIQDSYPLIKAVCRVKSDFGTTTAWEAWAIPILDALCNRGLDPFAVEVWNKETAVQIAMESGVSMQILEVFLPEEVDGDKIKQHEKKLLLAAVEKGLVEAIDLLVRRGAQPALEVISCAARIKNIECLEALFRASSISNFFVGEDSVLTRALLIQLQADESKGRLEVISFLWLEALERIARKALQTEERNDPISQLLQLQADEFNERSEVISSEVCDRNWDRNNQVTNQEKIKRKALRSEECNASPFQTVDLIDNECKGRLSLAQRETEAFRDLQLLSLEELEEIVREKLRSEECNVLMPQLIKFQADESEGRSEVISSEVCDRNWYENKQVTNQEEINREALRSEECNASPFQTVECIDNEFKARLSSAQDETTAFRALRFLWLEEVEGIVREALQSEECNVLMPQLIKFQADESDGRSQLLTEEEHAILLLLSETKQDKSIWCLAEKAAKDIRRQEGCRRKALTLVEWAKRNPLGSQEELFVDIQKTSYLYSGNFEFEMELSVRQAKTRTLDELLGYPQNDEFSWEYDVRKLLGATALNVALDSFKDDAALIPIIEALVQHARALPICPGIDGRYPLSVAAGLQGCTSKLLDALTIIRQFSLGGVDGARTGVSASFSHNFEGEVGATSLVAALSCERVVPEVVGHFAASCCKPTCLDATDSIWSYPIFVALKRKDCNAILLNALFPHAVLSFQNDPKIGKLALDKVRAAPQKRPTFSDDELYDFFVLSRLECAMAYADQCPKQLSEFFNSKKDEFGLAAISAALGAMFSEHHIDKASTEPLIQLGAVPLAFVSQKGWLCQVAACHQECSVDILKAVLRGSVLDRTTCGSLRHYIALNAPSRYRNELCDYIESITPAITRAPLSPVPLIAEQPSASSALPVKQDTILPGVPSHHEKANEKTTQPINREYLICLEEERARRVCLQTNEDDWFASIAKAMAVEEMQCKMTAAVGAMFAITTSSICYAEEAVRKSIEGEWTAGIKAIASMCQSDKARVSAPQAPILVDATSNTESLVENAMVPYRDSHSEAENEFKEFGAEEGRGLNWASIACKATMGFRVLDLGADVARVYIEPTRDNVKQMALNAMQTTNLFLGPNVLSYCATVAGMTDLAHEKGTVAAVTYGLTSLAFMAAPHALIYAGIPYVGAAYMVGIAGYSGYKAVRNVYDLYHLYHSEDYELRSLRAYGDLYEKASKLTEWDYFSYKTHSQSIKLEKLAEKKALIEEHGKEFGAKLYKYFYEPMMEYRISLENSGLSEREVRNLLKTKVSFPSEDWWYYDKCLLATPDASDKSELESEVQRYYCFNVEAQEMLRVTASGNEITAEVDVF